MEDSALPICRRLGIGFVAYSPLGRGFLTGKYTSTNHLGAGDFRLSNPRFQDENLQKNAALLPALQGMAEKHGATQAQIALAWLLSRYERLVVIPGTRSIARLEENCGATGIVLSEEDITLLNTTFTPEAVYGGRYTQEGMKGSNA